MLSNKRSFTLVERAIVMLVVGVIAAAAVPKLLDIAAKARQSTEERVVGYPF